VANATTKRKVTKLHTIIAKTLRSKLNKR